MRSALAVLSDAWALAAEADYVRGDANAAREAMDKALQVRLVLAAQHAGEAWGVAGLWRIRGALRAALGDNAEAADSFAQARTMMEQLYARTHGDDSAARVLLHTLLAQADHALRGNQNNLAREAADSARILAEQLAHQHGGAWLGEAGACWDRLGEIARTIGGFAPAQYAFARAVDFRRLALERAPDDARLQRRLAAALLKLGAYIHEKVGFNSRLDEIQAGILLVKLKHIDEYNKGRRRKAALYTELLSDKVTCPIEKKGVYHVYHQYTIRSPRRDEIQKRLKEKGISSVVYYPVPLHLQKPLEFLGYKMGDLPSAEKASREVLSLPIYPELKESVIEEIAEIIRDVV